MRYEFRGTDFSSTSLVLLQLSNIVFAVQKCIVFAALCLPAAHNICYGRRASWNTISFFRTGTRMRKNVSAIPPFVYLLHYRFSYISSINFNSFL